MLPSILDHVLPSGEIVCGEYVSINPTRNDQNAGSFRINLETGKWADFATGDFGGDPASLIAYLSGSSQVEAARWLRLLAEWFPHPHHPSPGPWRQLPLVTLLRPCACGPRRRTVVETYLASRRLGLPEAIANSVVRFHPRCPFGLVRQPCMLVLMRNIVDAAPQAIQRTAIAADGTKIGRKTLGPSGGAAVMLDVVAGADELSVSEGFETALTAHQLGQRPVWALGSAGEIAKFPVLDQVTTLNILAENDVANERAVAACADRWMSAGREVFIIKPKSGSDLNNAFCSTRSTL